MKASTFCELAWLCLIKMGSKTVATILLVESEPNLARAISNWLTEASHSVHVANDETEGLNELKEARNDYDLAILDLVDPETRGLDICKMYRQASAKISILMLGADWNTSEPLGAAAFDAYVVKPIQMSDLSEKVNNLLSADVQTEKVKIRLRNLTVDTSLKKVMKGGVPVHLAPKEYALFEFLLNNRDQIFSHEELLLRLWGLNEVKSDDTVRGHIKRLRRKLDEPGVRSIIASLYGFGYKLESDEHVQANHLKVSTVADQASISEQSQRTAVATEHSLQL
jgi:DNA-binding response OmpR family regulator